MFPSLQEGEDSPASYSPLSLTPLDFPPASNLFPTKVTGPLHKAVQEDNSYRYLLLLTLNPSHIVPEHSSIHCFYNRFFHHFPMRRAQGCVIGAGQQDSRTEFGLSCCPHPTLLPGWGWGGHDCEALPCLPRSQRCPDRL